MSAAVSITAFYKFVQRDAAQLPTLQRRLKKLGADIGMRGLTVLATEGVNGTVCGTPDAIAIWKKELTETFGPFAWNDSCAEQLVFKRWLVKVRGEIVALRKPETPAEKLHKHLSPEEFHAALKEDVVVLDARNSYETKIGIFEHAVDPNLKNFKDFPAFAKQCEIPKDKKILMYCTGGIRCEKALLAMEEHGYENVYQLKGGILAYLKAFPHAHFQGECFVFDQRVAVDQELRPSATYRLCAECGDPTAGTMCEHCSQKNPLSAMCA